MKKRDYFWARAMTQITGVVFFTQLFLEVFGALQRKPGFEWVIYACGATFILSLLYLLILVLINAWHDRNCCA